MYEVYPMQKRLNEERAQYLAPFFVGEKMYATAYEACVICIYFIFGFLLD